MSTVVDSNLWRMGATCDGMTHVYLGGQYLANAGETIESRLLVVALKDIARVVIRQRVPEGLTFVKSEPPAKVEGNLLVWHVDFMDCCEQRMMRVWLKTTREIEVTNCASAEAVARVCFVTKVTTASLAVFKAGPPRVALGGNVVYDIVVKNTGSGVARDVVLTDTLPKGFAGTTDTATPTIPVGMLGPGAAYTTTIAAVANERGTFVNTVVAESSNAGRAQAYATTVVVLAKLDLSKAGTKEQFIHKPAEYEIVAANAGDEPLEQVRVTDTAPAGTKILEAKDGTIAGNTATWVIPVLKPGEKKGMTIVLTSPEPGVRRNTATAACGELGVSADTDTLWKGRPALLIEVVDTEDPVQVGEETKYILRVTNQGSADDKTVKIVATFPKQTLPVAAKGATKEAIKDRTVTFDPYPVLPPKKTVEWTITAKGAEAGDARLRVELTSETLQKPLIEEESTQIY